MALHFSDLVQRLEHRDGLHIHSWFGLKFS